MNSSKVFFIGLLLSISFSIVSAQNLLSNGDFEDYYNLPTDMGQWRACVGWESLNTGFSYPYGSPDYFHNQGLGNVHLPHAIIAYVRPQSGDAIMGFVGYNEPTLPNFREYLSAQLTTPMVIGRTYEVSFWITNGIYRFKSQYSCDRIGVHFSVAQPIQQTGEPLGVQPHYEIPGDVWEKEWRKISFNIHADKNYEHITLGNFYPDSLTSYTYRQYGPEKVAYYYVDNIKVIDSIDAIIPPCGESLTIPTAFSPNDDAINDVFIPIITDNASDVTFKVFNSWGQEVFGSDSPNFEGWDGTMNGIPQPAGVYLYVLDYECTISDDRFKSKGVFTLVR